MPQALLLELDLLVVGARSARAAALARALSEEHPAADTGSAAFADALDLAAALTAADGARALLAAVGAGAPDDTAAELVALRAGAHYGAWLAHGISLLDGGVALVTDAAARAPVAIVTRGTRDEAALVLGLTGLDAVAACVVGAEDARRGAPAPDAHEVALGRLARRRAVDGTRALALHDSAAGLRAARGASVPAVAVGPVPPHEAAEGDGWAPSLVGHTAETLAALAERSSRRSA